MTLANNNNSNNSHNPSTIVEPPQLLQEEERKLREADADLLQEATASSTKSSSESKSPSPTSSIGQCPYAFVPLKMKGQSHHPSPGSKSLILNEVSLADLTRMTEAFYAKAFQDHTLDKFIQSHDDPHGTRFARWIHQKLSGSNVWDLDRMQRGNDAVYLAGNRGPHKVHDRTSAHIAAWFSPKRPVAEVGRHFQLDECRVWMRLHFWAMRETGLLQQSPSFVDYYVRFIGHFVRVYESSAPVFARESFRWSADPANIARYLASGRRMSDVLGLSLQEAEAQIPQDEANDFVWPYNTDGSSVR